VGRLYSQTSTSCQFDYPLVFINAASEGVGCTIGALVINSWGRRWSQTGFYIAAGLAVFLMGFETSALAVLLVGIVAKMSSLAASVSLYLLFL
jgi:hypothetical protein